VVLVEPNTCRRSSAVENVCVVRGHWNKAWPATGRLNAVPCVAPLEHFKKQVILERSEIQFAGAQNQSSEKCAPLHTSMLTTSTCKFAVKAKTCLREQRLRITTCRSNPAQPDETH